jgi:hypothetical protein
VSKRLFRVRFFDQSEKKLVEVVVENVSSSDFIGLITLEKFVFKDNKKLVILPEEDAARSRFGKTEKLHIPYHSVVYMEEFIDDPVNLKQLPFMKEVENPLPTPPPVSGLHIKKNPPEFSK